MLQALHLNGVKKQHQPIGLRFISASDAVEYYVHALISIEERATKLGIFRKKSNLVGELTLDVACTVLFH